MVVILLLWVYLFFCFLGIGLGATLLLSPKKAGDLSLSQILVIGIAFTTVFCSAISLFRPIDEAVYITLILLSAAGHGIGRNRIDWKKRLPSLPKKYAFFLIAFGALLLLQSATAPYFFDNDSYYLQTTKWIEQYGIVPGVANVHPFLGQMSPWHIVHAAFSFHFFGFDLNDLNGFFLLVVAYEFICKLVSQNIQSVQKWMIYGFFGCSLIWFRFVDSPSPDLLLYASGFWLMIDLFSDEKKANLFWLFLIPFLVFCKVLALPMLLLLLAFRWKHLQISKRFIVWSGFVFLIFLGKNYLSSGMPFYPYDLLAKSGWNPDWKIPEAPTQNKLYVRKAFNASWETLQHLDFWQKMGLWLNHSGLTGWLNRISLLVFTVGLLYYLIKNRASEGFRYFAVVGLFFVGFLLTSPQPRFFIHWTILGGLILASNFLPKFKLAFTLLPSALFLVGIPLFWVAQIPFLANNSYMSEIPTFQSNQILLPHPRTRYPNLTYRQSLINAVPVNHYTECEKTFVFLTFDANLPAVCPELWKTYQNEHGLELEMRGDSISDGFRTRFSSN